MTMTYKDKDGKEYVASESLDRRLRRTEFMLMMTTIMIFFLVVAVVLTAWQIDRNNLLNQIKNGLEACRVVGVID